MSAPLIQHIADALDCAPDEARTRLEDAVADLKQHAAEGHEVTIPDLGQFSVENDHLSFTPESSLARQVNHRFVGLTPVSVSQSGAPSAPPESAEETPDEEAAAVDDTPEPESAEAAPEPETTDEPEAPEEPPAEDEWQPPEPDDSHHPLGPKETPPYEEPEHTVLDADEEEADEETDEPGEEPTEPTSTPEPEAPAASEPTEKPTPPKPEPEPSAEDEWKPEPAEPEPEPESEEELAGAEFPAEAAEAEPTEEQAFTAWPDEEQSEAEADEENAAAADRAPKRRRPDRDRSSSAGVLIGLFLVIAAVAVGGYILQQQGVFSSADSEATSPATTQQQTEPPADQPQAASEPGETAAAGEAAPSDTGEAATETTPPADEQPAAIDRAEGGYTIVIASRAQRSQAESVVDQYQQELQDEGLPVEILVGESNGQTRYRVGVGQFPTIDAATAERDRLAERLPDGAWVLRIRPNSS